MHVGNLPFTLTANLQPHSVSVLFFGCLHFFFVVAAEFVTLKYDIFRLFADGVVASSVWKPWIATFLFESY